MQLVTIAHDRITVELAPQDCFHLARACQAADYDLAGSTVPDHFFGVEAATTASLPVAALYQALAVAFMAGAYAGESSYYRDEKERDSVSLATLAARYGGSGGQGEGAATPSA